MLVVEDGIFSFGATSGLGDDTFCCLVMWEGLEFLDMTLVVASLELEWGTELGTSLNDKDDPLISEEGWEQGRYLGSHPE